jgi:hypothetical protein
MKHLPENLERHLKITHLGPNIETTLTVLEPSLDDTAEHLSLAHTEHEIEVPGEVQERVTHQSKKAYADMRELLLGRMVPTYSMTNAPLLMASLVNNPCPLIVDGAT